jgi:AcrR family transcriptional regulator
MARWEPNARDRLLEAAMQLFAEQGYDRTTAREIAESASLTERTFFRHFADKREVLFGGSSELQESIEKAVATAARSLAPLEVVAAALSSTSAMFEQRREFAGKRRALILAHPELLERELIKLASLGGAIARSLQARGLPGPASTLVAETGIAIFKSAFDRWLDDPTKRDLAAHVHEVLGELGGLTAASCAPDVVQDSPVTRRSGAADVQGGAAPSSRRRSATSPDSR